jgi:hypothetical protein
MRTVTIFSTKGSNKTKIQSDAKVWGELKSAVAAEGYDLSTLAATENINRCGLDNDLSVLPEGDFVIFLRPVKTKSGVELPNGSDTSRRELKAIIKEFGKDLKDHLKTIEEGRNWTQLRTSALRKAIADWVAPESDSVMGAVKQMTKAIVKDETLDFDAVVEAMLVVAEGNEEATGYVREIQDAKACFDTAMAQASEDEEETLALIADWNIIKAGF